MNTQPLSDDHRSRIHLAISKALNTDSWELLHLVNGGYSGAFVYSIKANNQTYIAKLDDLNDKKLDPHRYYPNMLIASEYGITPRIYYSDPAQGITLMEHIQCKPLPVAGPGAVRDHASLIRDLHHMPEFTGWKTLDEIVQFFLKILPASYLETDIIRSAISTSKRLSSLLSDPADDRSCHCDLNPNNLLYNGRKYYLVDWQASCKRNLYFDLACMAIFFYYFDRDLQNKFLEEYLQRQPTEIEQAKYELMQIFVNIYYGIIFISLPFLNHQPLDPLSENQVGALSDFNTFMQNIGAGFVNIGQHEVQQQFGHVFLSAGLKATSSEHYNEIISLIKAR